jgi:hypothetical protein
MRAKYLEPKTRIVIIITIIHNLLGGWVFISRVGLESLSLCHRKTLKSQQTDQARSFGNADPKTRKHPFLTI